MSDRPKEAKRKHTQFLETPYRRMVQIRIIPECLLSIKWFKTQPAHLLEK
ncbi:hypothetical protein SAMN04487931_106176 [Desulfobacula phenolica]|uniref:Uncharacterized protein n=1 Tax=Desulfobacula phenolica TaxID=90732 RepID=A0A1H2HCZ0_9BACT|nr:hypothetical protein SAMN04487931_106176 [Desulfobacula phenolica]